MMGDDDLGLPHVDHYRGMSTDVAGFIACDGAADSVPLPGGVVHDSAREGRGLARGGAGQGVLSVTVTGSSLLSCCTSCLTLAWSHWRLPPTLPEVGMFSDLPPLLVTSFMARNIWAR